MEVAEPCEQEVQALEELQVWHVALQDVHVPVVKLANVPGGQADKHCPLKRFVAVGQVKQVCGPLQVVHEAGHGAHIPPLFE
jgi:hypothetical protein